MKCRQIHFAATYFVREPHARPRRIDVDQRACARRIDEITITDVDPDVARSLAGAVEAGEGVARLEPIQSEYQTAYGGIPLRRGVVRQRDAELPEHGVARTTRPMQGKRRGLGSRLPTRYGTPRYCITTATTGLSRAACVRLPTARGYGDAGKSGVGLRACCRCFAESLVFPV